MRTVLTATAVAIAMGTVMLAAPAAHAISSVEYAHEGGVAPAISSAEYSTPVAAIDTQAIWDHYEGSYPTKAECVAVGVDGSRKHLWRGWTCKESPGMYEWDLYINYRD